MIFDGFEKKDVNKVKSFISREKIKVRLPYGKKPETLRRYANFVGTTNEPEFLTDITGNVRFLVFNIKNIKHDWGEKNGYEQNINIDRVYSQAYALLLSGFDYKLSREEIKYSEQINGMYQVTTPEAETINRHFSEIEDESKHTKENFYTATQITQILRDEFGLRTNNRNVGKALHYLGYERRQFWFPKTKKQDKGYYIKKIEN